MLPTHGEVEKEVEVSKWEGKDEGGVVEKKVELEVVAGKCDSKCVCVVSVRVQGFLFYFYF